MIREFDIREKMAEAVRREISVPDLARWVMSNSWNMHQDSSESAVDLASEIHLLLADRDNFQIDDAAFLDELATLNKALEVQFVNIEDASTPRQPVFSGSAPLRAFLVAV